MRKAKDKTVTNTRILCVDDDEKILNGILRQQGDDFDISIAVGPQAALEMVEEEDPFAVVLSDMRMPEMNGVQLLSRIRDKSPNTVRMILTGFAELDSTIEAVNQGHIFRFLSKPCDEDDLASAFQAGLRQYALVEAETELVEGTLRGSVKVLSEVLALVSPLAFGQSTRVSATVNGILNRMQVANPWQIEIAAMLSALGCLTLPQELLEKKLNGEMLSSAERQTFAGHPLIAGELIRSIPRLDFVADIITYQNAKDSSETLDGTEVPLESQILKLATDFDLKELNSESSLHALAELKKFSSHYNPQVFEALSDYVKTERNLQFAELMLHELRVGMVLAQDIKNVSGTLLMSKGQEITKSASRLLENFSAKNSIKGPFKVVVSKMQPAATV
jgi:response regulator RpfG family c-di-GMP phosphodiesterase